MTVGLGERLKRLDERVLGDRWSRPPSGRYILLTCAIFVGLGVWFLAHGDWPIGIVTACGVPAGTIWQWAHRQDDNGN